MPGYPNTHGYPGSYSPGSPDSISSGPTPSTVVAFFGRECLFNFEFSTLDSPVGFSTSVSRALQNNGPPYLPKFSLRGASDMSPFTN